MTLSTTFLFTRPVGLPIEKLGSVLDRFPGIPLPPAVTGGVLRVPPGDPLGRGGQIIAHLQDLPGFTPQLAQSVLTKSVSAGLQMTTIFSGVAAVTGVLNLGVSVAGFAIMAKKLNRLQAELGQLRQLTEKGFDEMRVRLDGVEQKLVDIRLISVGIQEGVREVKADLEELGRLDDIERLAKLSFAAEQLSERRLSDPSEARHALRAIGELRNFLGPAIGAQPAHVLGTRLVRDLGYVQAWAAAACLEAAIHAQLNDGHAAISSLTRTLSEMMPIVHAYARALLGDTPADFIGPGIAEYVTPQAFARWMVALEPTDEPPSVVISRWQRRRDDTLAERRLSRAQYLEGLDRHALTVRANAIERMLASIDRLETYRDRLEALQRSDLPAHFLDEIEIDEPSEARLYLLPVATAA